MSATAASRNTSNTLNDDIFVARSNVDCGCLDDHYAVRRVVSNASIHTSLASQPIPSLDITQTHTRESPNLRILPEYTAAFGSVKIKLGGMQEAESSE